MQVFSDDRRYPTFWLLVAMSVFCGSVVAQDREYGAPQLLGNGFLLPSAVAYDSVRDRVFALELGAHRLQYASLSDALSGTPWTPLGEITDRADGAALVEPEGVAVDSAGNVFVADTFNNQARLYRYDSTSDSYSLDVGFTRTTRTTVAGVAIDRPRDIATGADGSIYLLDSSNQRVLRASDADANAWSVYYSDSSLSAAQGLAVSGAGELYIADTDNHRIVVVATDGSASSFGRYGRDRDGFRYPQDVAVGDDGRVYVADTHNHRIVIFRDGGGFFRSLGRAPTLRNPQNVFVGSDQRVFIADNERSEIVAFLGPEYPPQFDAYIRDTLTDLGEEPSLGTDTLIVPDILVRARPDINLETISASGFDSVGSEAVVPGGEYYVYVMVNNRGTREFPPAALRFLTTTLDDTPPYYLVPDDWFDNEMFEYRVDGPATETIDTLNLPSIPGQVGTEPGRRAVGPIVWRPAATTTACDSVLNVMARITSIHDPIIVESENGLEQANESNNIGAKRVPFVARSCIPEADRYESNDWIESAAAVDETWTHLHARCPITVTRALHQPYPDTHCEGVFEDGFTVRSAEEIWQMEILDLSLHSRSDRDFFQARLPYLQDPAFGDSDIAPERIRTLYSDTVGYVPEVMPECGAVQRIGPGPTGADRTIWVNTSTELIVEVLPEAPPESIVAPRGVYLSDEQLHIYSQEDPPARNPDYVSGSSNRKRIVCPLDLHEIDTLQFSFGERDDADGALGLRDLERTGGYKIQMSYITTIERGTPGWANDPGIVGGVGRMDCFGIGPFAGGGGRFGFAGNMIGQFGAPTPLFPFCGLPGFDRSGFFDGHKFPPGVFPDCLADGPGCFSVKWFYWPGHAMFDMAFAAPVGLTVELRHGDGETLAETQLSSNLPASQMAEFADADLSRLAGPNTADLMGGVLRIEQLDAGYYGLFFAGAPTEFAMSFAPVVLDNKIEP